MDIRSYESSFELTFVLFNACLFRTMSCSSRIDFIVPNTTAAK